jgi:DEAD/DEAH box helicase domain-containing protein
VIFLTSPHPKKNRNSPTRRMESEIMEDHVVLDVEIQKTIEELPRGWDDSDKMGVAVAVLYEFKTDRFRIYGPNDVERLKDRLLEADRISGYNIWRFDYNVIWGLPRGQTVDILRPKTNDILLRIWRSLGLSLKDFSSAHKGWKLDQVMNATFGIGKIGNGADAPKWYQAGEIHRVINYCVDDVALERDLAVFVDRFGFVLGEGGRTVYLEKEWQP